MTEYISEIIENEWYIIRHSGEIPEIAYNSAMYQLSRAQDGPRISLTDQQVELLQNAAIDRFIEIILRDLQHFNSTKLIYRGIARSIVNYRRFCTFCSRQRLEVSHVRAQVAEALLVFLNAEIKRLRCGDQSTIINCGYVELQSFAGELGLELDNTFPTLAELCPSAS